MSCGERLIDVIRGLGVHPEHLHVIEPLPKHHDANVALIRREIQYRGLSVIVPRRACIHVKRQSKDREPAQGCAGGCACTPVTIHARSTD
jgi:indolepyruvate ferredoxin oxidoreductase alpha subunit